MKYVKILISLLIVCTVCIDSVAADPHEVAMEIKIIPDRVTYTPGSQINYTMWLDLSCPGQWCSLDHCLYGYFGVDSNVEIISQDNGFCFIQGKNDILCDDNTQSSLFNGPTGPLINIKGKIKENTPVGTIITSSGGAYICQIETQYPSYISTFIDTAQNQIVITQSPEPVPEFPSMFLPAILIIGILGTILFVHTKK